MEWGGHPRGVARTVPWGPAGEAYSAVQLLRRLASEVRAATDGLRVAAVRSTLLDEYPAGRESAGWRTRGPAGGWLQGVTLCWTGSQACNTPPSRQHLIPTYRRLGQS